MCVEIISLTAWMTAVPSFLRVRKLPQFATLKHLKFFYFLREFGFFRAFFICFVFGDWIDFGISCFVF